MKKISIRPRIRIVFFGLILFLLCGVAFLAIDEIFFNFITSPPRETQRQDFLFLVISNIAAIFVFIGLIRIIQYKVIFIENIFIAPKLSGGVQRKFEIECSKLLSCEIEVTNFLGFYFIFTCAKGKKHNLFITHFTNKQKLRIIKLIQERGGLLEYDANNIIGIKKKINRKK